jgi:biotin-(acetyl-CoA carboxylase) ligase
VFHAILKHFWQIYQQWLTQGFEAIESEYLKHAHGFNSSITIGDKIGVFTGLSKDGGLILIAKDGTEHTIISL